MFLSCVVSGEGCGIRLYRFLIIVLSSTFYISCTCYTFSLLADRNQLEVTCFKSMLVLLACSRDGLTVTTMKMTFSSGTYQTSIELVREDSVLYDASLRGYKDHTLKKNIWKEIEIEMNIKSVNLSTPFDNWCSS